MVAIVPKNNRTCELCRRWRKLPANPDWGICKAYMTGAICRDCMIHVLGESEKDRIRLLTCPACSRDLISRSVVGNKPNGITPKQGTCDKFKKRLW